MKTKIEKSKVKNRIYWFCEEKINAFSPTISPAPKSTLRNEIESLYEGILYYLKRGIKQILVQKKYMGSYADVYLHKNIEESYLVSRNGYKVSYFDQEQLVEIVKPLHQKMDWETTKMYIIQAELMPWSAIGKKLIANEYSAYLISHKTHLNYLEKSDLYSKIEKVKSSDLYQNYINDIAILSKKALKAKYPVHIMRQYNSIAEMEVLALAKYKENIARFEKQLNLFGTDEKQPYLKPFNILKTISNDNVEHIVNDNLSFAQVNDDDFLYYEFESEEDFEEKFPTIEKWVNKVNQSDEEGVMIKPKTCFIENIPPALKVRNNDYLSLIYGIDFQDRLSYQLRKRKITKKIECSINDWAINHKLLCVPYKKINQENYYFKNLVFDRIIGETIENQLDKRL